LYELHSPKNVGLGDTGSILEKLNELDLTQLDFAEVSNARILFKT